MKLLRVSGAASRQRSQKCKSSKHCQSAAAAEAAAAVQASESDILRELRAEASRRQVPRERIESLVKQLMHCIDVGEPWTQVIVGVPIGGAVVQALAASLQKNFYTKIRSLCFWSADLGDIGCASLCDILRFLQKVRTLELIDCGFGMGSCRALSSALQNRSCSGLTSILLDHNPIGIGGLAALKQGFLYHSKLEVLSLSFCDLPSAAGSHVGELLAFAKCRIRRLNLEGNMLADVGIAHLSKGIMQCSHLVDLNIANNLFGASMESISLLAASIETASTLKNVDIDGNLIGNDGARVFLDVCKACPQMVKLQVSTTISPALYTQIVEATSFKNRARRQAPDKTKARPTSCMEKTRRKVINSFLEHQKLMREKNLAGASRGNFLLN